MRRVRSVKDRRKKKSETSRKTAVLVVVLSLVMLLVGVFLAEVLLPKTMVVQLNQEEVDSWIYSLAFGIRGSLETGGFTVINRTFPYWYWSMTFPSINDFITVANAFGIRTLYYSEDYGTFPRLIFWFSYYYNGQTTYYTYKVGN